MKKYSTWIPRALSILIISFFLLMSLDIFDMHMSFWQTVLGLFMHNIPTIVLIAILIFSWKNEIIGAISYILLALAYEVFALRSGIDILGIIFIGAPLVLTGILFLKNYNEKKKQKLEK